MLQPLLTDQIRYAGGAGHIGWPPTLLTNLAVVIGMASMMMFVPRETRFALRMPSVRSSILSVASVDFSSGALLFTGLLIIGGGLWVIIYSSTVVWTALLSLCMGQKISPVRWCGVMLVTSGMLISASGSLMQASSTDSVASVVIGGLVSLAGTQLHAAMYVFSERAIKQAGIDKLLLGASMGVVECTVLLLWNAGLLATHGTELYAPADRDVPVDLVLVGLFYLSLTLVNVAHAWSFFHMIAYVGAVSMAMMKGIQLVCVFGLSVILGCHLQATQCFSWGKASGAVIVVVGLLIYAHGAPSSVTYESPLEQEPRRSSGGRVQQAQGMPIL